MSRRSAIELAIAVVVAAAATAMLLVPAFDAYTEDPPLGVYTVGLMGRLIGQPTDTRVIVTAVVFGLLAACLVVGGMRLLRWAPKYDGT